MYHSTTPHRRRAAIQEAQIVAALDRDDSRKSARSLVGLAPHQNARRQAIYRNAKRA